MRNLNAPRRSNAAAAALVLALLAVAGPSVAAEFPTGFFLGLDVGAGGTSIHYRDGDRTISEDPEFAGLGGLRLGYAVSPHFALALEARGIGREEGGEETGIGVGVVSLTWRPRAGGFYVRGGLGAGGGRFQAQDMDAPVEITDRLAWIFAVGYDWRLGEHTALGLCAESLGISASGVTGFEDDSVAGNGASIQFTWYP
ncbi:outer membrane beta-barrel protein [bacterium]|nr:outer membrane beta-barrel protein [bacterium]